MHAEDIYENDATKGKGYISQEEVFFQIHNNSIGTEVIQERETREDEQGIEEECRRGGVFHKRPPDRHEEDEKIAERREYEEVFRYAQVEPCSFQRASEEGVLESEKRIGCAFILDFIHKFI